ncbi:MAG: tetratricopeptide repeat protein, partial [Planctomycetaceae bacterium]
RRSSDLTTESVTAKISHEDQETTAQFCQLAAEEFAAAGKTAKAIAMFDQAGQHDPALADRNAHRLAVLHAEAGNTQSARRQFAQALEYQPRNANLRSDHGFFLLQQGHLEPARQQLQDALRLDPQNARASMNLGLVSAQLGDIQTAESQFESIVGPTAARQNAATISEHSDEAAPAHIPTPVAGVLH